MYMVYWTEIDGEGEQARNVAHARAFESADMRAALHWMEELRNRQHGGAPIAFVTMASENPHSVGRAGVAEPSADYNWKKRRS